MPLKGTIDMRPVFLILLFSSMLNAEPVFNFTSKDNGLVAEFIPMKGSLPVTVRKYGNEDFLRFPCNFKDGDLERASWDIKLDLDLSNSNGLEFIFLCSDPSPVSQFSVYLHSGDGWYRWNFYPDKKNDLENIRLLKLDADSEDTPDGWSRIDIMRISAWKLSCQDTEFLIRDFKTADCADSKIAVLLNNSALKKGGSETGDIFKYCKLAGYLLDSTNVKYRLLGDAELRSEDLLKTKVIILPYAPSLSSSAVKILLEYMEKGGKIIVFYEIPESLAKFAGIKIARHLKEKYSGQFAEIRPADGTSAGFPPSVWQNSWNIFEASPSDGKSRNVAFWFDSKGQNSGYPAIVLSDSLIYMSHVMTHGDKGNKSLMLFWMIGALDHDLLKEIAKSAISKIFDANDSGSFTSALRGIEKSASENSRDIKDDLKCISDLMGKAQKSYDAGEYLETLKFANEVKSKLSEAFAKSRKPIKCLRKMAWCHSAFGIEGKGWDESIRIFAESGFTDIIPNMLWGGCAFYKSSVLPIYKDFEREGDQLEKCLAACHKYGIRCHVWKVNWNTNGIAPKEFMDEMRKEKRLQIDADGNELGRGWLCPSHPKNRKLEADSMLEIVRNYGVDGIHFDYIRYPDSRSCFCENCRKNFEAFAGTKVEDWPKDLRSGKLKGAWNDFRRAQIDALVEIVALESRKLKPGVQISAAVFPNWETDRDSVGQDWKKWCDKGWLDFVCPMNYTESGCRFDALLAKQKDWAGKVPLYPGIGLSTWEMQEKLPLLFRQMREAERNASGFVVFEFNKNSAEEIFLLVK